MNRTHMNWNSLIGMGPLCDSNFKNKYFIFKSAFILNLYLLIDSEDSLRYSFERTRIAAEVIVRNVIVV